MVKSLIGLPTFSSTSMEESADVSSDGLEPFRVRRYCRQHPGQLPAESTSLHSLGTLDVSTAGSDYILVQEDPEAPEDTGFNALSENLVISDDTYIPAAQSDEGLFDDLIRTDDCEAFSSSNALPLQDHFESTDRHFWQQLSHVHSLDEPLSAEVHASFFCCAWPAFRGKAGSDRGPRCFSSMCMGNW